MDDAGRLDTQGARILAMLAASELPICLFDDADVLRYANAAFRRMFGIAPGEAIDWAGMMRRNEADGIGPRAHTDDFEKWLGAAMSRRGKLPFRSFEIDLKDGRWLWMTEIIADGWMLAVAADVTRSAHGGQDRQARLDRDIALRVARTDHLTGALNRRGILDVLDEVAAQLPAEHRHYALALVDLDYFKSINDAHGHEAGDDVLQAFVRHVQSRMRRADFFGRYGGEEFLLVLPDTDATQAEGLLARIRADLPAVALPGCSVTPQFSAGVIEVRQAMLPRTLLQRVDAALYHAKRTGRARTVIGEPESSN